MTILAMKNIAGSTPSDLRRLFAENVKGHPRLYVIAVLAMVLVAITTSATAWIMGDIIDAMTQPGNRARVFMVAAGVVAIFFLKGMATYVQIVAMTRAGNRTVARQQRQVYDKLLRQGVAFFGENESSDVVIRLTQAAGSVRAIIDAVVVSAARDFLTLVGLIGVMVYQQPALTVISLVAGPVAMLGVQRILAKVRKIAALEMGALGDIVKVIQETSAGIQVVKAFALEDRMSERMNSSVRQVESRGNKIARLEALTSPLMDTLSGVAIASVVAMSAVQAFGKEPATAGQLMSFVTALLMAYEPAKRLSRVRVAIERNLVGVRMLYETLDQPDTIVEAAAPIGLGSGPGQVEFHEVAFEYGTGRTVIKQLSLVCEAGKTTALVGPSGGGKTTILNLIMRLYDPTVGHVSIDGVDLRQANIKSLRDKIAFVGQGTFLFSASVMDNIRVGRPDASEAEVVSAAKAANAHEFICALGQGYETQVGENGAFLSGGQRQRLAIARAILKDSPILLLDEATSALDATSESLVQDALRHLTRGRTTIVIAHRLSTVLEADRICVIEAGTCVQQGSADELLAMGGLFRTLYDQQFRSVGQS